MLLLIGESVMRYKVELDSDGFKVVDDITVDGKNVLEAARTLLQKGRPSTPIVAHSLTIKLTPVVNDDADISGATLVAWPDVWRFYRGRE